MGCLAERRGYQKESEEKIMGYRQVHLIGEIQLRRIRDTFRKRQLVVLDVGSYDGIYDIRLAETFENIIVHCVEPHAENYELLKENTKPYPAIKSYKCCISNMDGKENFFVYSKEDSLHPSPQSNGLFEDSLMPNSPVTKQVDSLMLSSFCSKYEIDRIDLLRINCEGGEYKIFAGKVGFLKRINMVHLSLHGKSPEFLSRKVMNIKRRINFFLKDSGFMIIYGYDLNTLKALPVGHISQIWIRKKFI